MVPSLMASKAKIIVISHSCKCFTVYKMLAYVFLTTFPGNRQGGIDSCLIAELLSDLLKVPG